MPEGLYLLARSLRAGLSLEQALVTIRPYCPRPLSEVFGRVADQVELGLSPQEALQRTAAALRLPDFEALAALVSLHRRVGGNLPAVLDRLAAGSRDRSQFRGYYRAQTALARLSAAFIALAPPVIALAYYLDQPDLFLNFFRTPLGLGLFGLVLVLEVVGIFWSMFLVRRVDY
jgi:tight adherence protein B